ncbi:MAG: acetyl-CoA hydrolase/transferase family protein [Solirubrobacterales bacterium]
MLCDNFREMYRRKLMTPEQAVKAIRSGTTMVTPLGNGEPPAIMEALGQWILAGGVENLHLISGLQVTAGTLYTPQVFEKGITIDSIYVGPVVRQWVQQGLCTYTPNHLSEVSSFTWRIHDNVETVAYTVSPMDKHGFFTTGTHCDYAWEVWKRSPAARNLIVEVNENMPRTHGNNSFHISEVTAVVENNRPLTTISAPEPSKEDETIAAYIADCIPDEACIQLGIGAIPNAVAKFLGNKRDLGVHSEMLTDSMVDLYRQGVITCEKKNYFYSKIIGAFAFGSKKLYDFLDDNTMVQLYPTRFVNDPNVSGRNNKLISINATMEVDLTGQCASETVAHLQYTGTGGQVDFVRGTWRSKGGKSFLACYSTYIDHDGQLQSKILPMLKAGAVVTTPRTDVQNVVTEYGIAELKGQSIAERVKRLIAVAHPDFRDWLMFEAKRLYYLA